ncbi:MAG: asparagine synthetase B [Methanobacteriaceae archaeon]|jgi:asparagine synthase (glutamine-hydrolysing)|nr:asparagine synthetase B [Methanobacteriaceae archaeon]
MCGIVGFDGFFNGNDFISILKDLKHRGPDSTGIYLENNEKIFKTDINLDTIALDENYSFALGHNLLSIYNSKKKDGFQPISHKNLILVFNGEIYNIKDINSFLKLKNNSSDSYVLINLIYFFYKENNDLLYAVKKSFQLIDGDFTFAVFDGENLAISRDIIGVKPLFYHTSSKINIFSSERSSIKKLKIKDIKSLKPGNILYNWEEIKFKEDIGNYVIDIDSNYLKNLEMLLKESIYKRIKNLDRIGLIFSGGVDSGIIAYILKEISKERDLEVILYAVGDENSKDILYARKIAEFLGLKLNIQNITEEIVKENLEEVVKFIGENNLMKIGVGMTIFLAAKMIHKDNIKVALSGQGADELFAGYNRYLNTYIKGFKFLDDELRYDINNMYNVNLERDDTASMKNSVELRLPYLDKKFIEYSLNIPIKYKIESSDDKIRKLVLRDLAYKLGMNKEFAYRPKKAAQYGSGIDKILRKNVLKQVNIESYL